MSYVEGVGFCDPSEYQTGKNTRLMPEELYVDEVYLLMAALDYQTREITVRWPSQILEVDAIKAGRHLVRFTLLDDTLQPYMTKTGKSGTTRTGVFIDGLWVEIDTHANPRNLRITEGYFKGFTNDWDDDLKHLLANQQVPILV